MKKSKEERIMWLEDWKQSGKSAWAYAKANGLNYQTFKNWTNAEAKQCFVEVPSNPIPARIFQSAAQMPEILIEKGEVKIRIPLMIGCCELRAVMEGLGASV